MGHSASTFLSIQGTEDRLFSQRSFEEPLCRIHKRLQDGSVFSQLHLFRYRNTAGFKPAHSCGNHHNRRGSLADNKYEYNLSNNDFFGA